MTSSELGGSAAVATVIDAARTLAGAGRWSLAAELLTSAGPDGPPVRLVLADLAVDQDFWLGTGQAAAALARAREAAGQSTDPWYEWEVELLALRHDYLMAVAPPDGSIRIGPAQHDPGVRTSLAERAERLHATAPADARGGWAAFWQGVIAENIAGEAAAAGGCYQEALASGEATGDDELVAEALRHLGAQAARAGEHGQARQLWERATRLRQRAGRVPGALSQLLALASNAARTGDPERAATLAAEVHGWADALDLTRLATQARTLIPGA